MGRLSLPYAVVSIVFELVFKRGDSGESLSEQINLLLGQEP